MTGPVRLLRQNRLVLAGAVALAIAAGMTPRAALALSQLQPAPTAEEQKKPKPADPGDEGENGGAQPAPPPGGDKPAPPPSGGGDDGGANGGAQPAPPPGGDKPAPPPSGGGGADGGDGGENGGAQPAPPPGGGKPVPPAGGGGDDGGDDGGGTQPAPPDGEQPAPPAGQQPAPPADGDEGGEDGAQPEDPNKPVPPANGDEAAAPDDPARPPTGDNVPPAEILYDLTALPQPVMRMRELIIEACKSGDPEKLRALIGTGDAKTRLSFDDAEADPIEILKQSSGDGEGQEILAILLEVLEAGYVHLDAGKETELYVWPYFFAVPLDKLTVPQRVELFKLITSGDYEDMKGYGAYIFYRVGIRPDGKWDFFLAGD